MKMELKLGAMTLRVFRSKVCVPISFIISFSIDSVASAQMSTTRL